MEWPFGVSICSVKGGIYNDSSCILQAGCHEFLNDESYVSYNFTSYVQTNHVKKMVEKNYYLRKPDISADVLDAIRHGLENTDEAPKGVKRSFLVDKI